MANIYTVSQINGYIKRMFEQDFLLSQVSVKGEVSNLKYHTSGHIYFSLKDAGGVLQAVMFAGNRRGLRFSMENGDRVVVSGEISVYERDGKYQIYAREITKEGVGDLYARYMQLKKRLEEMGMFDAIYKKPIPRFAGKVGIVTAKTGAAIQDMVQIARRRNPYVQLYLYPAQVQGSGAAETIVKGIQYLDQLQLDVIIIGRGGGSIEDLWAFNEEIVATAVFECRTPIISAVGHETDTTIVDWVSDLRAPTPSAAAELAVFDYRQLLQQICDLENQLQQLVWQKTDYMKEKLEHYRAVLRLSAPQNKLQEKRRQCAEYQERMNRCMNQKLTGEKYRLELCCQRLSDLSPLKKLCGGFGYITADKIPVVKPTQVSPGDRLSIRLAEGEILAEVLTVNEK